MAGFNYAKKQGVSETAGNVQTYSVAADQPRLAIGDLVDLSSTANANGVAGVIQAVSSASILGVIASVDVTLAGESLTSTGLAPNTAGTLKVYTDQAVNYDVDVTNGTISITDVNSNVDFVDTDASLSGGLTVSNMTIDGGSVGTANTLPFRIVALLESDGTRVRVRPNATTRQAGTTGEAA